MLPFSKWPTDFSHTIGIGCDKIKRGAYGEMASGVEWASERRRRRYIVRDIWRGRSIQMRQSFRVRVVIWQFLYFMLLRIRASNLASESFSLHSIFEWICWINSSLLLISSSACVYVYGSPEFTYFCSFNLSLGSVHKWIVFSFWQSECTMFGWWWRMRLPDPSLGCF